MTKPCVLELNHFLIIMPRLFSENFESGYFLVTFPFFSGENNKILIIFLVLGKNRFLSHKIFPCKMKKTYISLIIMILDFLKFYWYLQGCSVFFPKLWFFCNFRKYFREIFNIKGRDTEQGPRIGVAYRDEARNLTEGHVPIIPWSSESEQCGSH